MSLLTVRDMRKLQLIAVHVSGQLTHREMLDGRAYLVAPVVPIIAGVLNGFLVPQEEIAAFIQAWDDLPLPIGHPTNSYGDYISARSPAMIEQSIGRFFNAHMDGARLLGELWLDIEKCQRLGGDAAECLRRLEAGEPLECSTAFFSRIVAQQGLHNGLSYEGIHRDLRPNHLALLPNGRGACSYADGCGFPQVHQCDCVHCKEGATHPATALTSEVPMDTQGRFKAAIHSILSFALGRGEDGAALVANLTHDDLRSSIYGLLAKQRNLLYGPDCITDIEDGYVIYRDGERMFRQAYTVGADNVITLADEREEVQRNTQYVPVAAPAPVPTPGAVQSYAAQTVADTTQHIQENGMKTKAEAVKALIAHAQTGWKDEDTAVLQTFSDDQLERLLVEAEARTPVIAEVVAAPAIVVQASTDAPSPVTLEAIQAMLTTALDARDQALDGRLAAYSQQAVERSERVQLVAHLTAHNFTEQDCTGMSLEALRKIVQTVAPATYAGMGFPAFPAAGDDDALPSDAPKWD